MAAGLAGGVTIALPKGRTLEGALALLKKIGFDCQALDDGRKLLLDFPEHQVRFLLLRGSDIPTYVEYGAADVGSSGQISCSISRKISMNTLISSLASAVWSWHSLT